jgi:hypothetical protein
MIWSAERLLAARPASFDIDPFVKHCSTLDDISLTLQPKPKSRRSRAGPSLTLEVIAFSFARPKLHGTGWRPDQERKEQQRRWGGNAVVGPPTTDWDTRPVTDWLCSQQASLRTRAY